MKHLHLWSLSALLVLTGCATTSQDGAQSPVTTLAHEQSVNTFMRLDSAPLIARLRQDFPDLPEQPDAKTVFIKLRELRNSW